MATGISTVSRPGMSYDDGPPNTTPCSLLLAIGRQGQETVRYSVCVILHIRRVWQGRHDSPGSPSNNIRLYDCPIPRPTWACICEQC